MDIDTSKSPSFEGVLLESFEKNSLRSCESVFVDHDLGYLFSSIKFQDQRLGYIAVQFQSGNLDTTQNKLVDILNMIAVSIFNSACLNKKNIELENSKSQLSRISALLSLVRSRSSSSSLSGFLSCVVDVVDQLLSPERFSIYFCDHLRREVFICYSKSSTSLQGLTLPFDQGVAGKVASSNQSIRVDNAYLNPLFYSAVDEYTGSHTQSILCVPVAGFERGQPVALLQALNKQGGFSEEDQLALEMVAEEVSVALRAKAGEIHKLRYRDEAEGGEAGVQDLEVSLLQEYGSSLHKYRVPLTPRSPSPSPSKDPAFSSLPPSPPSTSNPHSSMDLSKASRLVLDYDSDPFLLSDTEKLELAVHMFRLQGLLSEFSIDPQALLRFLSIVQSKYRNNPYHHFTHAWCVLHLCFQLLRSGCAECLRPLDHLALLIAAICHDIDHTGVNNAFEVASSSDLAQLYCDDVVLERHHSATTLKLLSSPEGQAIQTNLSAQDRLSLRQLVVSSIMATDMGKHFEAVEKVSSFAQTLSKTENPSPPFNPEDPRTRRILLQLILHSADIGALTQAQPVALKWVDCVLAEFRQQAEKETMLGLDPTPFMHGLDSELKGMQLQSGFVGNIVIPLWSGLCGCFPALSLQLSRLSQIRDHFQARITALSTQQG